MKHKKVVFQHDYCAAAKGTAALLPTTA